MRVFAFACSLALTTALSACAGIGAPAPQTLAGTTWSLERIMLGSGETLRGDGQRVTFGADGRLALTSCNQCSGPYRERDGVLTVAPAMACTLRGCPPEAIELERYISGTLTFRRQGDYLFVTPAQSETVAAGTELLFLPTQAE
ncbi:MAG: META domain-containing protein [Rubricoccaceae bacterium]